MQPSLHIRHAFLSFQNRVLFNDLNLDLIAGKWTCLLGPSGVGKTSLLRLIAGLPEKDATIHAQISTSNNIDHTQQVSYMAQTDSLLPWLNVLDNVLLGSRLRNQPLALTQAKKLLDQVGLSYTQHLFPAQLSGGMRQRVALARTLAEHQPIVLMDEPFSAVDAITRYHLQNLAAILLKDKTVFFITHDPTEALRLAHEIYIMCGKPASLIKPFNLLNTPPRESSDQDFLHKQAELFKALSQDRLVGNL
jgi:putative hydroxymethylpyrimidine transport system ATP-binding protein